VHSTRSADTYADCVAAAPGELLRERVLLRYDTTRHDTRCCFNVRSKVDVSQLNLPTGTDIHPDRQTGGRTPDRCLTARSLDVTRVDAVGCAWPMKDVTKPYSESNISTKFSTYSDANWPS